SGARRVARAEPARRRLGALRDNPLALALASPLPGGARQRAGPRAGACVAARQRAALLVDGAAPRPGGPPGLRARRPVRLRRRRAERAARRAADVRARAVVPRLR